MNGSEKQVKWAEDIKAKFRDEMVFRFDELTRLFDSHPAEKQALIKPVLDAEKEAYEKICAQTEAKFWIDNQHKLNKHFVEAVRKGTMKL